MLNQLINLLMQDPSNVSKVSRISALLQEYLKKIADNAQAHENLKLINQGTANKDTLRMGIYGTPRGQVKTKIVFKYDVPSINRPQCKDVFMRLIKTAYDAYIQLAKNPMCQNPDGVEAFLKKAYEVPYDGNSDVSVNTNKIPGTKEQYSIYDLLKPQDNNYGYHQAPNNVNDINIYGNYKPILSNVDSNAGNIEPKSNIFGNLMDDKLKPAYDLNPFGYGINPNTLTPNDLNFYKPESQPTENVKYDGNLNIYNIYDNVNKKELLPQKDSNIFIPENFNFNPENLKVPDNWKPPVNMDMNGQSQNSLESIMSILATAKPPEDKNGQDNSQLKYLMYPDTNVNIPNQNIYPYQNQKLIYQYGTPGVTNLDNPYQKEPQYKYTSNQFEIPNMDANSYQQNVYNNYLNKLPVLPNLQQSDGVTNALKLDPSSASVIELTFVLKRATPLIYQPLYFVKFRIPYSTFLTNMNNLLLAKPHLKIQSFEIVSGVNSLV
ncbi:hypothetical protein O3G_MSEX014521 [Manduca sexta]|uniref:Uncharacterized protein n=1 Tax=Manduca sexta TaxID=7130 RepID=A0A921ZX49_MANSE|nr:hypothetical protein O3G_MSEX014521 [Manduca sexta]